MPTKKIDSQVNIEVDNLIEIDLDYPLLDERFSIKFYKELSKVEGIDEYLRLTILTDLKKYFMATDEKTRDQVRGHLALANSIKKRIVDARR